MKVRYFIPSNLNLPSTSSHSLPLLQMDSETSDNIHITVTNILNSSDIDTITEQQVRHLASLKLNLDLSSLPHKILVRQIIESFLLSTTDHPTNGDVLPPNLPSSSTDVPLKATAVEHEEDKEPADLCRVVCKLSEKKNVAVRSSGGKPVVSIRELSSKDGKATPTPKCISLFPDQWSIFRKSIPAIEEAIAEVDSRVRSELQNKQAFDKRDISASRSKENGGGQNCDARHRPRFVTPGQRSEDASTVASTPQRLVPIEIIRFDGKNYEQWAERMESYLNQLKVGYVLSEPCPSAVGVRDKDLAQTLSAAERWMGDDHICSQNILNSLCDNLLRHYTKKSGTAKDLWEEIKLVYLHEEHGARVSLVKKYIEFQISEEKSIFKQVHELHQIADALAASGMYVEEKFHVNVIISKLPPSWKPCSVQLMKEDFLPVWMLMNHLKAEEEYRQLGNKGDNLVCRAELPVFQPNKKFGAQRIPMKKPGFLNANHEADWDKKVRFCSNCKKKGHTLEHCWFRKADGKDIMNEKESVTSANAVAGADTNGASGHSKN